MKAPRRSPRARSARFKNFTFDQLEDRRMLAGDLIYSLTNPVPVENRISILRSHLDFDQNESVQLLELQRDQYGFAHFKYQLNQNGIPVQNSVYSVHVKDGQIVSLSGEYVAVGDNVAIPKVAVREATAFRGALAFVGAEQYIWQDPLAAAMEGLPASRPQGELVYYTPHDGSPELAYKFDVFALEPFTRDYVYVDATNGTDIVGTSERMHAGDEPGTGTSLYDGQVDITVDKFRTHAGVFEYRLREGEDGLTGQRPIQTRDVGGGINTASATDYTSPTTDFSSPDVQNGVQIHYGTEQTYDYFLNVYGRDSFDGNGSTMRSFGSYRSGWVNATWTGSSVRFGDGDGINYGPVTSLDVVGHEYGHGVVQFSADLDYSYQSGALNESFADIFGSAVERYARGTTDWLVGADFALAGDPFRSMADPKLYGDPDTFMGDNWHPSSDPGDYGGVHTNSGVQNKWFYVLSEGEAGTNDLGWTYDVAGIGFDAAAAIAYRNLTVYLTSDSDYADARIGAIQAAIDIFGANSPEQLQTEEAWRAVGLDGPPEIEVQFLDGQFQPLRPLGSQVYYATATGTVEAQVGVVTNEAARDIYSVKLDANQSISAVVEGTDGVFEPVVRIQGPGGTTLSEATPYGDTAIANAVAASDAGSYTIIVSGGTSGTLGDYELSVYLNADIESEPITGLDNNSIANAQDISLSSVDLGNSDANRLAVLGTLSTNEAGTGGGGGGGDIVSGDDFESGTLGSNWSTSTSSTGRIRVTGAYGAGGGALALIMDSDTNGTYALNEATWNFNIAGVATPFLNFDYMEWFDETDPLPITFEGSVNGDGVSVSDDGTIWHTLLNATQSPAGVWESVSFDMLAFAASVGLNVSGDLYLKFQQYDNQPIDIADGRGFDEISISEGQLNGGGGAGLGDWYKFVLREDETVSLAVSNTESYGGVLDVELYSQFGALLESETQVATTNVDGFISQYTNPFPDDGDDRFFFAKVIGDEGDYSLVITRGAEFNVEVAGEVPMDISFVDGALGYVSSGEAITADPDDFADNTVLDTAFSGLRLSNEVTGGSVYAEDVTGAFTPATGTQTFAPNLSGLYGWREGRNELRVDFAEPQMIVSLDVVSNDAIFTSTDQGIMRAFAADGTLLEEVVSAAVNRFQTDTMTISHSVADIAYIVATGLGSDETPLDHLVYGTTDVDIYQFDAFVGQEIAFGGFLPGEGPYEFVNGLKRETGSALRMELFDPSGTSVATGARILQATADQGGTYELHVTAAAGAGEYYVGQNPENPVVNGVDFGPIGSRVAEGYSFVESDVYAVGRGYGWTALGQVSFVEQRRGNDLIIDLARFKTGSFAVDVVNATYDITVHMGQVRNADAMTITLEGVPETFTPNAGPNVVRSYTVAITDGQISLDFSGLGGLNEFFNLCGISIERVSSRPLAKPPSGHGDKTNLLFVNNWSTADAIIGNRVENNGIREMTMNVAREPARRILLGSQKIAEKGTGAFYPIDGLPGDLKVASKPSEWAGPNTDFELP